MQNSTDDNNVNNFLKSRQVKTAECDSELTKEDLAED